jgi:hypothetical protein
LLSFRFVNNSIGLLQQKNNNIRARHPAQQRPTSFIAFFTFSGVRVSQSITESQKKNQSITGAAPDVRVLARRTCRALAADGRPSPGTTTNPARGQPEVAKLQARGGEETCGRAVGDGLRQHPAATKARRIASPSVQAPCTKLLAPPPLRSCLPRLPCQVSSCLPARQVLVFIPVRLLAKCLRSFDALHTLNEPVHECKLKACKRRPTLSMVAHGDYMCVNRSAPYSVRIE